MSRCVMELDLADRQTALAILSVGAHSASRSLNETADSYDRARGITCVSQSGYGSTYTTCR